MKNVVEYNAGSVQVKDPKKGNVVVYAHPNDIINLSFDISSLKKELINGDLVIQTNSGGRVTIANYSVMFMQQQTPVIVDSLSQEYSYNDLLGGYELYSSLDNNDSIVVSRSISTPKSSTTGEFLASAESFLTKEYDQKELVGMIDVEDQHPILSNDSSLNPFLSLSLFTEGKSKYDVDKVFSYAGRTILNQEEDGVLPVVIRILNPKSEPLYGTKSTPYEPGDNDDQAFLFKASSGGGDKIGNEYSSYMYDAEMLDYSSLSSSAKFIAYDGTEITRGINIYISDPNTIIQRIILKDVPDGVTFISTNEVEVQPIGNNSFMMVPRGQSPKVDLYFVYNEKDAVDSNGSPIGMQDVMQSMKVEMEGFNSKYQQLVMGSADINLDFREVGEPQDIKNFSMYNTYTFSTRFDPLIVRMTNFDDYVQAGSKGYTYDLLEGNDTFKGGEGDDIVYMGSGNNEYFYAFGSDRAYGKATLDGGNNTIETGTSILKFNHEAYVYKGKYTFDDKVKINLDSGNIIINNQAINSKGKVDDSVAIISNFNEIHLEEEDGISAGSNNSITITSTKDFNDFKIYSGESDTSNGQLGNSLFVNKGALIDFSGNEGAYITTVKQVSYASSAGDFDINHKVYFAPNDSSNGTNIFNTIYGSEKDNDYIILADKGYDLYYEGRGGKNTVDFSHLSSGVTFTVDTGKAIYSDEDTLLGVNLIVGSDFSDTIYASGEGNLTVYADSTSDYSKQTNNKVSYEKFDGIDGKGVTIDYVTGILEDYIKIGKYGRGTDMLYGRSSFEVTASKADDIFYMDLGESHTIDGLSGKNTLDYSKDASNSGITINIDKVETGSYATGSVNKSLYVDSFQVIHKIVGTSQDDTFIIKGEQSEGMTYDGRGGYNKIDYSEVGLGNNIHLEYNITRKNLEKIKIGESKGKVDNITGFSEVKGTLYQDDLFIVENLDWQTANNALYDANGSLYGAYTKDIQINSDGKLENAGNVLFLNYSAGIQDVIDLQLLTSSFSNFNTLRLSDKTNSTILYSETEFDVLWGSQEKGIKNTFDASTMTLAVDFKITGALTEVDDLKLYNFNVLIGSDSGSTFHVEFTKDDYKNNYHFKGGQSLSNTLDYSGTTVNLLFNLGNTDNINGYVVKNGDTGNRDTFEGINNFVGGSGNDTFILNPNNLNCKIDGGRNATGTNINTISFENYSFSVSQANINTGLFTNIDAFILTNHDDVWAITKDTQNSMVNGGGGLDTILIDDQISSVSYQIGERAGKDNALKKAIYLDVDGGNTAGGYTHTLEQFEVLHGSSSGSDKVSMEILDNHQLLEAQQDKTVNFYFVLNKATVDYTTIDQNVTLSIFGEKSLLPDVSSTLSVDKNLYAGSSQIKNHGIDYYSGVEEITLGGGTNTIKLDVTSPESFNGLKINAGSSNKNIIDLSDSSSSITYDAISGKLNDSLFEITGWNTLKTGDGDDKIILSRNSKDLVIDTGYGEDTIDFTDFTDSLVYTFSYAKDEFKVENGKTTIVTATNVNIIITGSGDNDFWGSNAASYKIDATAGNNNKLDYSSAVSTAGFAFYLTNDNDSYVDKGGTGFIDEIVNINSVVGTNLDDTFHFYSDSKVKSIDGGERGRDELIVYLADGATEGFNFDLTNNKLTGGGLKDIIAIYNIDVLHGSSLNDTFSISDVNTLKNKGLIDAGGGDNNKLTMQIKDDNNKDVGLYLDLSTGYYYRNEAGVANKNEYIVVQNIQELVLGNGDNIILFSDNLSSGDFNIILGSGQNLLSFEKVNHALIGTFDEMKQAVIGDTQLNITGDYGLKLTAFSDTLMINQGENALIVDGGSGKNTVDYSKTNESLRIVFNKNSSNTSIVVNRNEKEDQLSNFSKFILGTGSNTIMAGSAISLEIVGDKSATRNEISYENISGGVVANLDSGTVYKKEFGSVDKVTNFTYFTGSKGDDIVYASNRTKALTTMGGDDILNLSKLTTSDKITYKGMKSSSSVSGISENGHIDIIASGTSGEAHSFNKIIFGDYKAEVIEETIRGREYYAVSGKDRNNVLNYQSVESGLVFDLFSNKVSYKTNTGVSDSFANFNEIYGSNFGDTYNGLSSTSRYILHLGTGDDMVSFTGSNSAIIADIDSQGVLSTVNEGLKIDKDNHGKLKTSGTRFDDIFYITDFSVFENASGRGIDGGQSGTNILSFEKLEEGITYVIEGNYGYEISNMQKYVFTKYNDVIYWTMDKSTINSAPTYLDFNGGDNNIFNINLGNMVGPGSSGTYMLNADSKTSTFNYASQSDSYFLKMNNLSKLNIIGPSTIDYFRIVFDGYQIANGNNIFTQYTSFNNISFNDGIIYEFRNYSVGNSAFETKDITKGTDRIVFSKAKDTNKELSILVSRAQLDRNVNLVIDTKVNITTDTSASAGTHDMILTSSMLQVSNGDSQYNQNFMLNRIADSKLTVGNNSFKVVSETTMFIFKEIDMTKSSLIDLSGYKGKHGDISKSREESDWKLFSSKLTGKFANQFTINMSTLKDSIDIKFTGTDDLLFLHISNLNQIKSLDGVAGINTLIVDQNLFTIAYMSGIENGKIIRNPNKYNIIVGAPLEYQNSSLMSSTVNNFQIIEVQASVGHTTSLKVFNILLDNESQWQKITALPSNNDYWDNNTHESGMPRNVLNAAGYSPDGTPGNVKGGIDEGGKYIVSFDIDENGKINNRMMQVDAMFSQRTFEVHNVQTILGREGKGSTVVFSSINAEQFEDLVKLISHGTPIGYGKAPSWQSNQDMMAQLLYFDMDFTKNADKNVRNDYKATNRVGGEENYDVFDFSAWNIHNSSNVYDMSLLTTRTSDSYVSGNEHIMWTVGNYENQSRGNGLIGIAATGQQKIILPQASVYLANLHSGMQTRAFIIEFPDVVGKEYYATYDGFASGASLGISGSLLSGSTGISSSYSMKFVNFTTFFLDLNEKHLESNIKIAEEGLFYSNKVHMYFSQKLAYGFNSPTSDNRTNVADRITYNNSVDFSSLKSGSYFFSFGAWQDQEHQSHEFVAGSSNDKLASTDYQNFMKDKNTGVGIIFTQDIEKNKVGTTDGYSSSVFYRMQGVNNLTLTNSNNTFAMGKVYSDTVTGNPYGPLAQAGSIGGGANDFGKTFLKKVTGGNGFDTLLDNSFSAQNKRAGGAEPTGATQKAFNVGILTGYSYNHYMNAGGDREGHIERFYKMDFDPNSTNDSTVNKTTPYITQVRYLSVLDSSSYGTVYKNNTNTYYNKAHMDKYKVDTSTSTIVGLVSRMEFHNFNKIDVDDYDDIGDGKVNGYYRGVQDTASVRSRIEPTDKGAVYKEVNLGGRYFEDSNSAKMADQLVSHDSSASKLRLQFVNSSDKRVDSSVIISDGYNGSSYTSYYGYKNWDHLQISYNNDTAIGGDKDMYVVFNTDFDFTKMHSKTFTVSMALVSFNKVFVYFQEDMYNYTVTQSKVKLPKQPNDYYTVDQYTYTIKEKGSTNNSFKFVLLLSDYNTVIFNNNATDAQVGTRLTEEQISNLETYGNLDGIDYNDNNTTDNSFLDNSLDDGSGGLGSYGRSTLSGGEEDSIYTIAYTDGTSGMTSFGRGSRSIDSMFSEDDSNIKVDSSSHYVDDTDSEVDNYAEDVTFKEAEDLDFTVQDTIDSGFKTITIDEETNLNQDETEEKDEETAEGDTKPEDEQDFKEAEDLDFTVHDTIDSGFETIVRDEDSNEEVLNIGFEDFTEKSQDFNMDELFSKAEDLLSDNVELSNSLNEMIDTVSLMDEDAVNITNQLDELDSMSFALDSMFSIDENTGNTEHNADTSNKKNNANSFSNSQ